MQKHKNSDINTNQKWMIAAIVIVILAATGILSALAELLIGLVLGFFALIIGLVVGAVGLVLGLIGGAIGLTIGLGVTVLAIGLSLAPILIPVGIVYLLVKNSNRPKTKRKNDGVRYV